MSNIEKFHARVKAVNPDGTLTPAFQEAIRASRKPPRTVAVTAGTFEYVAVEQGHFVLIDGIINSIFLWRGDVSIPAINFTNMIPMNPYDKVVIDSAQPPLAQWWPW